MTAAVTAAGTAAVMAAGTAAGTAAATAAATASATAAAMLAAIAQQRCAMTPHGAAMAQQRNSNGTVAAMVKGWQKQCWQGKGQG